MPPATFSMQIHTRLETFKPQIIILASKISLLCYFTYDALFISDIIVLKLFLGVIDAS